MANRAPRVPETPSEQQAQAVPLAPHALILDLNACRFDVVPGTGPDGEQMRSILFTHLSGVLQFRVVLNSDAAKELVRQLTSGIVIANGDLKI